MPNLSLTQRAIVVAEEGLCPLCERTVKWEEVDRDWYVCNDCVEGPMAEEKAQTNLDHYLMGQRDGMAEMLKSVLTQMVERGEFLGLARKVIRDIEDEKQISLR